MAGEGWYDAMTVPIPFCQPAGKHDTLEMLWHDRSYAPIFEKYNRSFGHLCLGDPSRNCTGVFESGYNLSANTVPVRKSIIPTVTIVDGTIEKAQDKVEKIIEDAKLYAEKYL